jgi:hypothetical protein
MIPEEPISKFAFLILVFDYPDFALVQAAAKLKYNQPPIQPNYNRHTGQVSLGTTCHTAYTA